jgi:hypothetical protein
MVAMVVTRQGGRRPGTHVKPSIVVCLAPLGLLSLAVYGFALRTLVVTFHDAIIAPQVAIRTLMVQTSPATGFWDQVSFYQELIVAGAAVAMLLFGALASQRRVRLREGYIAVRNPIGFTRYRPLAGITRVSGAYLMPWLPGSLWLHYAGHRLPVRISGLGLSNRSLRALALRIQLEAGLI